MTAKQSELIIEFDHKAKLELRKDTNYPIGISKTVRHVTDALLQGTGILGLENADIEVNSEPTDSGYHSAIKVSWDKAQKEACNTAVLLRAKELAEKEIPEAKVSYRALPLEAA